MNAVLTETLPEASCEVMAWRHGLAEAATETVVEEVPVALVYNGISHAVLLATPLDLEDFALGFSLAEGILGCASDLYDIAVQQSARGIELQMTIAGGAMHALKLRRRSLAGRTGCGLCGAESLDMVTRPVAPVQAGGTVDAAALHAAMAALRDSQVLHQATGAVHAAGWAGWDGRLQFAREDVGRHNALDKVIGAMARSEARAGDGFLLITSRVSLEMAQKAAMAGVSALVGMSAPTFAAVELAERAGMTLLAFARGSDFVCYTHAQHLAL